MSVARQCDAQPQRDGSWRCVWCGFRHLGHFRKNCQNGHAPMAMPFRGPIDYVTSMRLLDDSHRLASMLPSPIRGVIGVPRSGLVAAAHVAVRTGAPLYAATHSEPVALSVGRRMDCFKARGPWVVVEDSVNSGTSLHRAASVGSRHDVVTAVVYQNPEAEYQADIAAVELPLPHLFEWHLFGSPQIGYTGLDFDGVICEDCPAEDDDDGPRYAEWLESVRPLHLPRPHKVPLIVTARLEKYRAATEVWLAQHDVECGELAMGPWESKAERSRHYSAGEHKGRAYRESACRLFFESCRIQARQIFEVARKPVIVPSTGEVFQ